MISIIVPVYQVESYLERCINSLIHQTYKAIEILLIDDGSFDSSPQICEEYKKLDERIRVFHKPNTGLSDTRNFGLCHSNGEYVLFVDSDDYIELDACERLISFMSSDIDIVVAACKEINNNKIAYQRHTNLQSGKVYSSKEYIIRSIANNEWYAPAWLNLYRKEFLVDNNLYFKKGIVHEDTEFLPRLFLKANRIVYVDYAFYNYVIREGSITTSAVTNEKKGMVLSIFQNWYELFQTVQDRELQSYLFGSLIRTYIASASLLGIKGWKIKGIGSFFALRYSLSVLDKAKVILFTFFPDLYHYLKVTK